MSEGKQQDLLARLGINQAYSTGKARFLISDHAASTNGPQFRIGLLKQ